MTSRAKINPDIMKWARIEAGYNKKNLPKKFKDKFEKWENGSVEPTWNQLRDLSNQYKRPSAFFFRTKVPPKDKMNFIEYRRQDIAFKDKTPKLIYNIRRSKFMRNNYIELLQNMKLPIINFSKNKFESKNIVEFALKIREMLSVSLSEQKEWIFNKNKGKDYGHYRFINEWKDTLNNLGILVFETENVSLNEMKALAIYYEYYPIILLNGSDNVNSRIFSLFHELVHLMLGESAICDLDEETKKEVFCNAVAGEFLVPSKDFIENSIVSDYNNEEWEDKHLFELSHEYGVSKDVILRKLLNINKISSDFYNSKIRQWNKEHSNKKKEDSGGSHLNNKIKYNGKMYSRLVLSAYENNVINATDFSEYMGLRLKHITKLETLLFGD